MPRPVEGTGVYDARSHQTTRPEGTNANIAFTVTLTPASTELVIVDYRTIALTIDGAATAGEGFTPTFGTLTFAPGQTSKTVRVPIIDDTIPDDGETFALDLYNASGATMVDTESWATGTIRNTEEDQPGGTGNVTMGAGLRPGAKATETPPDPNVGAPVLDSTALRNFSPHHTLTTF